MPLDQLKGSLRHYLEYYFSRYDPLAFLAASVGCILKVVYSIIPTPDCAFMLPYVHYSLYIILDMHISKGYGSLSR